MRKTDGGETQVRKPALPSQMAKFRGGVLEITLGSYEEVVCSRTGLKVVFTSNSRKYIEAKKL